MCFEHTEANNLMFFHTKAKSNHNIPKLMGIRQNQITMLCSHEAKFFHWVRHLPFLKRAQLCSSAMNVCFSLHFYKMIFDKRNCWSWTFPGMIIRHQVTAHFFLIILVKWIWMDCFYSTEVTCMDEVTKAVIDKAWLNTRL